MKVRGDFVTNSSSSSFGYLSIKCRPLVEMLENYDSVVKERGFGEFLSLLELSTDRSNGKLSWFWEEWCPFEDCAPDSLDSVLSLLCAGIVERVELTNGASVGADAEGQGSTPVAPLIRCIAEHRGELEDSIDEVYWTNTDQGWGGDSQIRFSRGVYSPELLESILDDISKKKGCAPEEVSDYDFNMAVAGRTSSETDIFKYDRDAGTEEYTHTFELI